MDYMIPLAVIAVCSAGILVILMGIGSQLEYIAKELQKRKGE